MILCGLLLRVGFLVALLLVLPYLLPFQSIVSSKCLLNHIFVKGGAIAFSRARRANHRDVLLRTDDTTVKILRTEMTCVSRQDRQGCKAKHFAKPPIIITHKQIHYPRQSVWKFGRIPTLHKFSHFAVFLTNLVPCEVLRPCVDLTHSRRHKGGIIIVIEIID